MKAELFKKVYIEGKEENLPEEKGFYFIMTKNGDGFYTEFDDKIWCLKNYDWYLMPCPESQGAEEIVSSGIPETFTGQNPFKSAEAMHDFARQNRRSELIKFLSESIIELPEGKDCIDLVDEYLKNN